MNNEVKEINPFQTSAGKEIICTLDRSDIMSAATIANAMSGGDDDSKLKEAKEGSVYWISDFVVIPVELEPQNSSDIVNDRGLVECDRVVLIDKEGNGFSATSKGIMNSLKSVVAMMGMPHTEHWIDPLPLTIQKIKAKKGDSMLIKIDIQSLKKVAKEVK